MKKIAALLLTTLVAGVCSAQPYGTVIDVDRCVVDIMYNFEDKRPLELKRKDVAKCYDLLPPGIRHRMREVDQRITPEPAEITIRIRVEDARCGPRKHGAATNGAPC